MQRTDLQPWLTECARAFCERAEKESLKGPFWLTIDDDGSSGLIVGLVCAFGMQDGRVTEWHWQGDRAERCSYPLRMTLVDLNREQRTATIRERKWEPEETRVVRLGS